MSVEGPIWAETNVFFGKLRSLLVLYTRNCVISSRFEAGARLQMFSEFFRGNPNPSSEKNENE